MKATHWAVSAHQFRRRPYVVVSAVVVPGQVVGLAAGAILATSIGLTWTVPSGSPTDYVVEYKARSSGVWLTFADGVGSAASATVTGLTFSTLYDFRVKASNAAGTGPVSATVSAPTTDGTVSAPVFESFPAINGGHGTVGVPATYTPATVSGGGSMVRSVLWLWDDQPIVGAPTAAGSTTTPTAGMVGLESLRIKETAANEVGTASRNSYAVDVYAVGPVDVSLTIQKPTDASNLSTYKVYRSTVSGGPYTDLRGSLAYTGAEEQVFTDPAVPAGLYYYVVCSADASGNEGDFGPELRKGIA